MCIKCWNGRTYDEMVAMVRSLKQSNGNKSELVAELEQLFADQSEWEDEGTPLEKASILHAIKFTNNSIIPGNLPLPYVEVHPDGEIAFTWRNDDIGIINIAFNKEGMATWAAYLVTFLNSGKKVTRTIKGRFKVEEAISDAERNIILQITKTQAIGR